MAAVSRPILLRGSRAAPNRQAIAENCAAVAKARLLNHDNIRMGEAVGVKRRYIQGSGGGQAICEGTQGKHLLLFIAPDASANPHKTVLPKGYRNIPFSKKIGRRKGEGDSLADGKGFFLIFARGKGDGECVFPLKSVLKESILLQKQAGLTHGALGRKRRISLKGKIAAGKGKTAVG